MGIKRHKVSKYLTENESDDLGQMTQLAYEIQHFQGVNKTKQIILNSLWQASNDKETFTNYNKRKNYNLLCLNSLEFALVIRYDLKHSQEVLTLQSLGLLPCLSFDSWCAEQGEFCSDW